VPVRESVGGRNDHEPVSDEEDQYYGPMGLTFRWLDSQGPEHVEGIDRYPEEHFNRDLSEAVLDPMSEAMGRLIGACTYLEIALFKTLTSFDPDMTFEKAELGGPSTCVKKLQKDAERLPERSRADLVSLLDDIEQALELRHGVVHGVYRRNYRTGEYESRRIDRKSGAPRVFTRVPYDRDDLLLASMRVTNMAADLFDSRRWWGRELGVKQDGDPFERPHPRHRRRR